jgi:hypothetical protein
MNTEEINGWLAKAWDLLTRMADGEIWLKDAKDRWDAYQHRCRPFVVIFGTYDAGKSSLLKRLLLDDGKPVPGWLTISGRRETFTIDEAECLGLDFADSPGLAGGNSLHEEKVLNSLLLADAYLWVLPPQLVTSGKDLFMKILTGQSFSPRLAPSAMTSVTIAAICRMDEAGIDPESNIEDYHDLCGRKVAELRSALNALGVSNELRGIFTVCADPFQNVVSLSDIDKSVYDFGRKWDGIDALQAALLKLLTDREALRLRANIRSTAHTLEKAHVWATNLKDENQAKCDMCGQEISRIDTFLNRLESLVSKVQSDLGRRINEITFALCMQDNRLGEDHVKQANAEINTAICEWEKGTYEELDCLVRSFDEEIANRVASPAFQQWLDKKDTEMGRSEPPSSVGQKKYGPMIDKAQSAFELGIREVYKLKYRETLEETLKKLQETSQNGKSGGAEPKGDQKKSQKRNPLIWYEIGISVSRLIAEGTKLYQEISKELRSKNLADRRDAERKEFQKRLDKHVANIEHDVMDRFREQYFEQLKENLSQQKNGFLSELEDSRRKLHVAEEKQQSVDKMFEVMPSV